ncbi:MAG: cell division protein FtsA [Magnetococcales bacterium]|nr:cell division protein FtsA [Magnetococcales bacterium]
MSRDQNIFVGLDIGTTKICCVVADVQPDGRVDIIGMGSRLSRGLKKGVVVDIEATRESMQQAIEEAEMMAGVQIGPVYAGISGAHIRCGNSHGVVAIRDREVTEYDVQRVWDAARAQPISADREILHVIPQKYKVDTTEVFKEPLGMSGTRLEASVHIITGAISSAQNIIKCANLCGLDVMTLIAEPLAAAEAVLTADEREHGVCLLDIGGGTTDIAIFSKGYIQHTAVLAIGGDHLTNDIAVGLRTPTWEAEQLKRTYGCALASMVSPDEVVEVPSIGERKARSLARHILAEILEPRVEELFTLVNREIVRSGFEHDIDAGIVLTGGSAITEGMVELAEEVFNKPVRRGNPQGIGGLVDVVDSPAFSTSVGLVLYASRYERRESSQYAVDDGGGVRSLFHRVRGWFSGIF